MYEDYSHDFIPEPWLYDDKVIDWPKGYKNSRALKNSINKVLLCIQSHCSQYWDWCMPEDEQKEVEKL